MNDDFVKIKNFFVIIKNYMFNNLRFAATLIEFLIFIATIVMVCATWNMAQETKKMTELGYKNLEFLMRKEENFSLNLTLNIFLADTSIKIQNDIINGNAIFQGNDFKKYYPYFDYSIYVENQSYLTLSTSFSIYMVLKQYNESSNEFTTLSEAPYEVFECKKLNAGAAYPPFKDNKNSIFNSGILNIDVSDDAKILLTIFAKFKKNDEILEPKQKSITNFKIKLDN